MIITIGTTHQPATDLGYLLHKHPDRLQAFEVSTGTAYVGYPEADESRCTAALVVEVDPVGLVRGSRGAAGGFALGQYVNDRPYAASSLMSVALSKVFRTAMTGRCQARPELAVTPIDLEIAIPALPCAGGPELARALFEPLGWSVEAIPIPLDPTLPGWGDSRYLSLRLTGQLILSDALNHLYVLLPVLDDAKHYWISTDEVDKLVRAGEGWLAGHPEKKLITERYLKHRGTLTRAALARLAEAEGLLEETLDDSDHLSTSTQDPARPVTLAAQRRAAVLTAIKAASARRVGDLGCGEGSLVAELLADSSIDHVLASDVSIRALENAERRLGIDQLSETRRSRLRLVQSSLTYRDQRLVGLDAAVLMEVIEHIDPPRLASVERNLFGFAAPTTVIITTPNAEYNALFETLPAGERRHRDHRFEWTRAEFVSWAEQVAQMYGYSVGFESIGPVDPELGSPTQCAIFSREVMT